MTGERNFLAKAKERCWKIYHTYYKKSQYKSHEDRYREAIINFLTPDACLLDAGCGSEMAHIRNLSPKIRLAIGIDVDQIKPNISNASAVRGDLGYLPFTDGSFDIVISRSVLEHLSYPGRVFTEISRVLRPNGIVVIMTPNKYDYVSIIAQITPFWFHRWILSRLLDRKEEDTFPTFYRANTRKEILSLLNHCGDFTPLSITLFNQYPAYVMFSSFLFRIGVFYERLTSRYQLLAWLRSWILVVCKKR